MSANQAQIDFWNGPAAVRWVTEQERLDRAFLPIDEVGLDRAGARLGERVIDIGCGCGATTIKLAERVGPTGSVRGVDISTRMLARAKERTRPFPRVDLVEADAAAYRFEADADLVFSRFGSMFFADPLAAFTNIRTALRRGGRICLVCWRSPDDNPWYTVPLRAAESVVPPLPAFEPGAPGPFSFAARERLDEVLTRAGFTAVNLERHDTTICASSSGLAEAVEFSVLAGPVARMILDADEGAVARVRKALADALTPHLRGERVELGASIWLATARSPT